MQDFEGKVAVVTGAASGIGRAMAHRFASEGMKVVLADVEEPALEATVQQFRREEFDVLGVRADVASLDSVEALAREAIDAYGKVHVLCNNAGVGGGGDVKLWEHSMKDWEWVFGVNLWGVVHGLKVFMPLLLEHGEEGHVVNTASIAGLTSGGRLAIYGTTKHAVVRISEALHLQLAEMEAPVKASVLCPGYVQTRIGASARNRPDDMWEPGTQPTTEEIARRIEEGEQRLMELGIPPEEVADHVLRAMRDERFWILTHDGFDDAIRRRSESILSRTNPVPQPPLVDPGVAGRG
jgi:NAD(P)-dependent dehydrogenase (short-subunit alcohol dehydrogenase family)